jgi:branched-subunit amino acid aminotransferase/4-amino-4-deoxychorismate lyase
MELMGLEVPLSPAEWTSRINEMVAINKADHAGFRIVVTGGFSEDGFSIPAEKNIFMMLHVIPANDPKQYEQGVSLITADYRRDLPAAKTTIYMQSMKMQPQLKASGAFEVLYHWNGDISECSRCNMFFIDQDGTIVTPDAGMLRGITRKQVISIARENNIPLKERPVSISEIHGMAGAFLTATTKGVLPVVKIDQQLIGDGHVHPQCRALQQLFESRVEQYIAATRLAQVVL